jgi:hypothetical protein
MAEFQYVGRVARQNRNAPNGFEGDRGELRVIDSTENGMRPKFDRTEGGTIDLITKTDTTKMRELEVARFGRKFV